MTTVSRVLLVDDDPDIRRLVQLRLAARGFDIATAENGLEALGVLERGPADLIFTDVSMPVMGGLELLARVKDMKLDAAVIVMTGLGSESVAVEALRHGADDYLRKPFSREELEAVLERTISRLELRRQNAVLRRQLDERRRDLEAELARAAQVQLDLLPGDAPFVEGFEVAGRCVPAREVGGDFYDWQLRPDGTLLFTLGDVMGKGMPAALLMATARAALRAVAEEPVPERTVDRAAAALEADFERSGSYVTLFRGHVDPARRSVRFVDAGHGHVFVRRVGGAVETLAPRGLPLGVMPGTPSAGGTVTLGPGDCLVLYSDGLPDSSPDRLLDACTLASALDDTQDAASVVEKLLALVDLSAPPPDDLTVVALRCS